MHTTRRTTRYMAIDILCRWEDSHLPIDRLVAQILADSPPADLRDRQLVQSLVYGVLRWRGYLDWLIGEYSSHPLDRMKSRTLQALRVGLFQLLFLDRIPPSAAINETVKALKDMHQPKWLTGFVNGVLRSIDRQRAKIPDPEAGGRLPDTAALSHPDWLIQRWQNRYGDAAATAICRANNRIAPLVLRVNTTVAKRESLLQKLAAAGIEAEAGQYSPLAVRIVGYSGPIPEIPGFSDGLFQVQDEAAQLVTMILGPLRENRLYLDGCAGLGGKTSHLAQLMQAGSSLYAVEPDSARLEKLRENLHRLRLGPAVHIFAGGIESLLPDMAEKFHAILIDAPCSGLGVIRRHPDIRWARNPEDLGRYRKIQLDIMDCAARLLHPGGVLVYATCSTEPEENREVVTKFLAAHAGFSLADCRSDMPESAARFIDETGYFQTIPGPDDLDGFFAVKLTKLKMENCRQTIRDDD